jgi:Zn finger protein HypA/HybF involved in hydrogenase expression
MALIKCKECQKEVSSEAVTCPHCGVKINDSQGMKLGNKIGIMLIVFMVLGWLISWIALHN